MLFVFAYVDLFSLYRSDFRADVEAGEIGGFTINQSFLLGPSAAPSRPHSSRPSSTTLGRIR
jgi:hypothetical protein